MRDNLDPAHARGDNELWTALEQAHLAPVVAAMPGGLDGTIAEGGGNLSSGQRQLVSLARALLTPSSILVLDEATAAVDVETDASVQAALRGGAFRDRTVLTVAHRLNTVLDSDRIVVLERGRVAEVGSPAELMKARGRFYALVREAGLEDAVGN